MNKLHSKLQSKVFLDGGDPKETNEAKDLLGFLDGQTTNPSLIVKNPKVKAKKEKGETLTEDEALMFYKDIIVSIAQVTSGPVSIQVFANKDTSAETMLEQARDRITWISNGFIKFPLTHAGLTAAEIFCTEGPVNMTLAFTQEQAAAVFQATKNAKHPVFISPFVGRLDDRGESGMDVVANIIRMYNSHASPEERQRRRVSVLTASVRSLDHLLYALQLGSPAITAPFKVLKQWKELGSEVPDSKYEYDHGDMTRIRYEDISLDQDWREYNIQHDLTDAGLEKFWDDWMGLLG